MTATPALCECCEARSATTNVNLLNSLRLRLTSIRTLKDDEVRALNPKLPLLQDTEGTGCSVGIALAIGPRYVGM